LLDIPSVRWYLPFFGFEKFFFEATKRKLLGFLEKPTKLFLISTRLSVEFT
jgi:hypothetical protein